MDRVLAQFFTAGQPLDSHLLGGANCWCGDARPWRMVHRRSPFRKKALQDARSQSGYEAIPLERDQTRNHLGTRLSSIWGRHPVGLPPQSGTEESDPAKCSEVIFIQVHVDGIVAEFRRKEPTTFRYSSKQRLVQTRRKQWPS